MPNGPLILAVDLRNPPKGGGYGQTHRENIFEKFENIFERVKSSLFVSQCMLVGTYDNEMKESLTLNVDMRTILDIAFKCQVSQQTAKYSH